MCVDFTHLNKACPKDSVPLPRIDVIVYTTVGHRVLSFMDAYSGHNQIFLNKSDEVKTAFIIEKDLYCYRVMLFGLKNAGETYQRLVNQMYKQQIGKTIEVSVDKLMVKSKELAQHMADLRESFAVLHKYKMKLNPAKRVVGVDSGKFLGFIVSERGIEVNPEKIDVILNMKLPQSSMTPNN